MRRRHRPWLMVLASAIVGLVVAVTVLSGAAQGIVATLCVFALLFAVVRGLDSSDVQNYERHVARDEVGSGNYHSAMGTTPRAPSPTGPVNTPEQDRVDTLERAWRAPSPGE